MKRIKIVAGNWKMNKTFQEADDLVSGILDRVEDSGKPADVDIVLCVPYPYLELARDLVEDFPVYIGAQNASEYEWGAYTGEVSAAMLASMGIEFCIIGHSERRKYFGEQDELLLKKVRSVIAQDMIPIFCCGEVLEERENDEYFKVVEEQLTNTLFKLGQEDFGKVVIAYEPVWAIGTGKTATPEQAQEDVDGGLIGGASLNADEFYKIIQAAGGE